MRFVTFFSILHLEKMSRNHYEDVSDSSADDEPRLVIDDQPKPKKITRRRKADGDKLDGAAKSHDESNKKRARVLSDTDEETPSTSVKSSKLLLDRNEVKWQKAMDVAMSLMVPLKVDTKDLTLLPDHATMECFKKAAQAWMSDRKKFIQLTFSTQKSLLTVMARFLFDFVIREAELNTPDWNPTGCVVWNHKCGDRLHCLHGMAMINKEQLVEMDINSENGQRALKETPEKAKIVTNRWGRSVVQIRNSDAMCCVNDAKSPINTFSPQSCGYFYSDGPKAVTAFRQIAAFVKAIYPNMTTAESHLLMPLVCECNYGANHLPLLGKQTCKVTPFAMSTAGNIDRNLIDDPKVLATLDHPAVLVFQCCNPVFRNTKANPQKNCDFKISSTDVVSALQLAKQMWQNIIGTKVNLSVPEFRWHPQYQVQNTILPTGQQDDDDCLF